MTAAVEYVSSSTKASSDWRSHQSTLFQYDHPQTTGKDLNPFYYLSKRIHDAEVNGLPEDWYLLEGTGFHIDTQLEQLQTHLKNHDDGAMRIWLDQVFVDMGYFDMEYFMKHDFIPYMQAVKEKDGRPRLIAPNYGDISVIDAYDAVERDGATKRAYKGVYENEDNENSKLLKPGIEDYFIGAPDNSIVVRTSPAGWSGYDGYDFPDTQTYFMQKVPNPEKPAEPIIKCFTVITDMNVGQNEEFLSSLGVDMQPIEEVKNDEHARLSTITETWVPIEGSSIEEVLTHLEKAANNKTKRGTSFEALRSYYSNFRFYDDVLTKFDSDMVLIADHFRKYATYIFGGLWEEDKDGDALAPHIIQELAKGLAYSILEISQLKREAESVDRETFEKRQKEKEELLKTNSVFIDTPLLQHQTSQKYLDTKEDFLRAIQFVQKQTGCAGGGRKEKLSSQNKLEENTSEYIQTVLGPRAVTQTNLLEGSGDNHLKTECVTCPFCSETVNAEVENGKLKCPNCHKKAGDSPT